LNSTGLPSGFAILRERDFTLSVCARFFPALLLLFFAIGKVVSTLPSGLDNGAQRVYCAAAGILVLTVPR
jgi:hypothetical protein